MIPILSKATCWYHWENTLAIVPKIFSAHVALYNPCIASGFASSAMGGPWNETHGPSQREGLGSDLCTVSRWEIMRPHTRKGCCMVAKHLDRHALGLLHWLCLHCCIVCKVHDSMVSLMSAVSTKHISWVQTKNSHSKWQRKAQELVVIYIYIYHMYSKYMYHIYNYCTGTWYARWTLEYRKTWIEVIHLHKFSSCRRSSEWFPKTQFISKLKDSEILIHWVENAIFGMHKPGWTNGGWHWALKNAF